MTTTQETPLIAQRKVLSTAEAALSISKRTLIRLTRAGELAHLRIGQMIRYRPEDLDAFLAARSTTKWEDFNPDRKKNGIQRGGQK